MLRCKELCGDEKVDWDLLKALIPATRTLPFTFGSILVIFSMILLEPKAEHSTVTWNNKHQGMEVYVLPLRCEDWKNKIKLYLSENTEVTDTDG